MLAALVLAGGASERMGRVKALLPDRDGCSFVVRLSRVLAAAGVPDVVVVTGESHEAVAAAFAAHPPMPVRLVRNPAPARGQLSSLLTGLDAVDHPRLEGLLVAPVDVPFVQVRTVASLIDAWRSTRAPVLRPSRGSQHGHPVLFDRAVLDDLRRAPLEVGAKAVVRACGDRVIDVAVDDEGCLVDIDTPDDYERCLDAAAGS